MTGNGSLLPRQSLRAARQVVEQYRRVFGRYPNLVWPQRFTEKMQWRKLFDRRPVLAVLCDKIAARDFIAARVGAEFLPELLWTGDDPGEIPFARLTPPYVLKCSHASSCNLVIRTPNDLDPDSARAFFACTLTENFGLKAREPGYVPVPPRILAERMLVQPDGLPPLEPKLFMFDGRLRMIHCIVVGNDRSRRDVLYDPDWNLLPWRSYNPLYDQPLPRPQRLAQIVALAERLAAGFDHLRVDFYDWSGGIRVGELTPYNLSGLVPFTPDEADFTLGSWWRLERPVRRALASWFAASG